jgi:hypothetical protein
LAIDHARPDERGGDASVAVILPDQLLLAQLGVRVDVAILGMRLDRRVLVDHGPARQTSHAVDRERAAEHVTDRATRGLHLGQHGLEQVLGGDHAVLEHVRGRAARGRGQVVDDVHALDRAGAVGGDVERADRQLDAAGIRALQPRQARLIAARAHQQADAAVTADEESLDQRRAEEAIGPGDEDLHAFPPAAPVRIWSKIWSMIQAMRSMSRVEIGSGAPCRMLS